MESLNAGEGEERQVKGEASSSQVVGEWSQVEGGGETRERRG